VGVELHASADQGLALGTRLWPLSVAFAARIERGISQRLVCRGRMELMDRRVLLGSLVVGVLGGPRRLFAQPASKTYRIGILSHSFASSDLVGPQPRSPYAAALLRGLHELGYVYGVHFTTEPRGGEGRPERWAGLAAELLSLHVDVIVASGLMLRPLKDAGPKIPIVMAASDDPVAAGLVASLGQPGGKFTGLSHQLVETTAKRLELLKEIAPGAAPVAVLW
jgi:putative ABC transport system substrate-binding protein